MRFEQALQAMREGKKVTRQGYARVLGEDTYYFIYDNRVWYYTGISQTNYDCPFTQTEILAEDWEIVENEQKS